MRRLTEMRFGVVVAVMAGCGASQPTPIAPVAPTPPPVVVQDVAIAKAHVLRFDKTQMVVYPATDHGLAPHAPISYADIACRADAGHTTCAARAHDDKREPGDLELNARLEQCYRVTRTKPAASLLRALDASPMTLQPPTATFTAVAYDRSGIESVVMPVIDCPGPQSPCPATKTVQMKVDHHDFRMYFGPSNETVSGVFAMIWAPASFAVVEGAEWIFNRNMNPSDLLPQLESMNLDIEGDETRLANLFDRTLLAFRMNDLKKAAAYAKDLDAWLAAHPTFASNADLDAARALFASILKGTLRLKDPCTDQGEPSRPVTQAPLAK